MTMLSGLAPYAPLRENKMVSITNPPFTANSISRFPSIKKVPDCFRAFDFSCSKTKDFINGFCAEVICFNGRVAKFLISTNRKLSYYLFLNLE